MKLLPLLLLLCIAQNLFAKVATNHKCDGIEVRGDYHKKEVIANGLNRPYALTYYKDKNEIFFSHNVGNDTEDKFEIRHLPHNTSISEPIHDEVESGFALALDKNNHVVYFGGSNGIFKRWLKTGKSAKLGVNYNIWNMFFKTRLYFIRFPKQQLYELNDTLVQKENQKKGVKTEEPVAKPITKIDGRVLQFVIDGDNDIFTTNYTGIYMIKNGSGNPVLMTGAAKFRALAINNKGDAYFAGLNAIFVPHKHNSTLHKIADVKNIFGLTFDGNDHMIYSNPLEIVKLVPAKCT